MNIETRMNNSYLRTHSSTARQYPQYWAADRFRSAGDYVSVQTDRIIIHLPLKNFNQSDKRCVSFPFIQQHNFSWTDLLVRSTEPCNKMGNSVVLFVTSTVSP